jgi:hypothetical protein
MAAQKIITTEYIFKNQEKYSGFMNKKLFVINKDKSVDEYTIETMVNHLNYLYYTSKSMDDGYAKSAYNSTFSEIMNKKCFLN